MAQTLFMMMMMILKEVMELLALKRKQLELKSVRFLLIAICFMCLHLMSRGILTDWPMVLKMIVAGSLICDIIIIWNNKFVRNLGGYTK